MGNPKNEKKSKKNKKNSKINLAPLVIGLNLSILSQTGASEASFGRPGILLAGFTSLVDLASLGRPLPCCCHL